MIEKLMQENPNNPAVLRAYARYIDDVENELRLHYCASILSTNSQDSSDYARVDITRLNDLIRFFRDYLVTSQHVFCELSEASRR